MAKLRYNKISYYGGGRMTHIVATATEIQNNFGKYLAMIMNGNQVIITKNGQEVGRMLPKDASVTFLTDSLVGALKHASDMEDPREERIREHYDVID